VNARTNRLHDRSSLLSIRSIGVFGAFGLVKPALRADKLGSRPEKLALRSDKLVSRLEKLAYGPINSAHVPVWHFRGPSSEFLVLMLEFSEG
jgi:hypothetical protein